MKKIILSFAVVVLNVLFNAAYSQDAATTLSKIDQKTTGWKDLSQTVEITLIDKNNKQELRTADVWQKGDNKRLLKFTSPESQKGVGFLSLPDDVMYLYMPAYGKERRIASSIKNQKFAGTDLSYEDLQAKKYSEKYDAIILKTENNVQTLELKSKTQSEYSKVVLTVDIVNFLPTNADFYDKSNKLVKTSKFEFAKSGNYWYPQTLTVKDMKTNHTTVVKTKNVKFDQNISDDIFTIRNLMK